MSGAYIHPLTNLVNRRSPSIRPDFQLTYAPQAWSTEKLAWRAVILLNLVRAVNNVCDAVRREIAREDVERCGEEDREDAEEDEELEHDTTASDVDTSPTPSLSPLSSPPTILTPSPSASSPIHISLPYLTTTTPSNPLTSHHSELVVRLEPLRVVQRELERRLGAGSGEECGGGVGIPSGMGLHDGTGGAKGANSSSVHARPRRPQEFFVRSASWKNLALGAVASMKPRLSLSSRRSMSGRYGASDEKADPEYRERRRWGGDEEEENEGEDDDKDWIEDVVREVAKRREGMRALWAERAVRECVRRGNVELGEGGEL